MLLDEVLNLRVPSDLKVALKKAAEHDDRSMSVMATRILREWLTEYGFLSVNGATTQRRRPGSARRR